MKEILYRIWKSKALSKVSYIDSLLFNIRVDREFEWKFIW